MQKNTLCTLSEEELRKNIGHRVRHLRFVAGETQKELGNYLGVTKEAITRLESGLTFPKVHTLYLIAHRYHVTADYLLTADMSLIRKIPRYTTVRNGAVNRKRKNKYRREERT